jgi:hypothetical protein
MTPYHRTVLVTVLFYGVVVMPLASLELGDSYLSRFAVIVHGEV